MTNSHNRILGTYFRILSTLLLWSLPSLTGSTMSAASRGGADPEDAPFFTPGVVCHHHRPRVLVHHRVARNALVRRLNSPSRSISSRRCFQCSRSIVSCILDAPLADNPSSSPNVPPDWVERHPPNGGLGGRRSPPMGRHGLCGHRSGAAPEVCNVGRFGIRELLGQRLGSLARAGLSCSGN